MIRLAHLSDVHLVADPAGLVNGYDSAANLGSVLHAFPVRPDVAVVTGDVAEDGSTGAYRNAKSLLSPFARDVHYVSGNHDDPTAMVDVLGEGDELRIVELSPQWTMALVSSAWAEHGEGLVAHDTLVALDEMLIRNTGNVLVCLHHPPLSTCSYSYCRLEHDAEVLRLLHARSTVRGVLSGHLHRAFDILHDGIRFVGAPSTCRQLRHAGPQPHFIATTAPPAGSLLELHADGRIVNHHISTGRRQPGAYWRFFTRAWRERVTKR